MNLHTGEIVEIYLEDGMKKAKVRVGAAYTRVSLDLVEDGEVGDEVLIESGVAISRIKHEEQKGQNDVSCNPR